MDRPNLFVELEHDTIIQESKEKQSSYSVMSRHHLSRHNRREQEFFHFLLTQQVADNIS
ncbi:hypothetical protein [Neobacillus niacini]|uniref:hypothetical protein n=1 Tax=Neobacillus niacini TaxID=86668 RepID=UPI0021CAF337|nr:hypothetical protein [Neobacillus niacini]MCM3768144.1 hypothetical protein [Neobacillus niacini]